MKKFLFLSIVTCFVIVGCAKKESKNPGIKNHSEFEITGIWELRQLTGQIGTKKFPLGNGNSITFSEIEYTGTGAEFGIFGRSNLPLKGTYEIVGDNTVKQSVGLEIPADEFLQRFVLNGDTTEKFFFQVKENQLKIMSGYFPLDSGVELIYEKQE